MAYLTQLSTSTLSNQNIATALLIHTFTNTTRLRKIFIDVFADQIAGNGNYVVYATRQRSGAGSAYEVGARTTVAVPSGVTAQAFPTIALMCGATDVIKVYLVGLAGDTATPDTIVDVSEEFVNVDASGNPTPNNSSGVTTILADYARRTGDYSTLAAGAQMDLVNAPNAAAIAAIQSGLATAAKLLSYIKSLARKDFSEDTDIAGNFDSATDSLEAIRDRGDSAWTGSAAPSAATVADAVWDELIVGHLGAGSTGKKLNDISGVNFPAGAIEFTYTVTNSVGGAPIADVEVWISTDLAGTNVEWSGTTDAFGVARDVNNNKPMLDTGTYYFWRQKSGFSFTNPDTESIS